MNKIKKAVKICLCFAAVFAGVLLCFLIGDIFMDAPVPVPEPESEQIISSKTTEPATSATRAETAENPDSASEEAQETQETEKLDLDDGQEANLEEPIVEEIKEEDPGVPKPPKPPRYARGTDLREIVFSMVGDTTLASESRKAYSGSFAEYYDLYGPGYFFENVAHIFKGSDYVVANLECALTDNQDPSIKKAAPYNYKGYAKYTGILTSGGVDAVNLSNNHTYDYSQTGYNDTVAALESAKIGYFGNGTVLVEEINGIKTGFVSSVGYGTSAIKQGLEYMEANRVELKIVTFHWGNMDERIANASQVASARYAIDNGADLVIGHHPHVLQGIERYKDRYIAYSIGNFIFDGNVISDIENRTSVILQAKFVLQGGEVVDCGIEAIPILTTSNPSKNNFKPILAEGDQKKAILDKIEARSAAHR
jgi:poly-gamma-glutamate synthesis protein (capsule biosynthesis protein)